MRCIMQVHPFEIVFLLFILLLSVFFFSSCPLRAPLVGTPAKPRPSIQSLSVGHPSPSIAAQLIGPVPPERLAASPWLVWLFWLGLLLALKSGRITQCTHMHGRSTSSVAKHLTNTRSFLHCDRLRPNPPTIPSEVLCCSLFFNMGI